MKKCLFGLILAIMAFVFLSPAPGMAQDGEKTYITDNMGRKWEIDPTTAATSGAGAGLGEVIGEAETVPWAGHMFDVTFGLTAVGTATDDTSSTEQALGELGVYYIPKTESGWIAIGLLMGKSTTGTNELTFRPDFRFTLFPDPFSSFRWNVHASVFSYTVQTGEVDGPRMSAWSTVPKIMFGVEVPRGPYSIEFGLGAAYPFSIQGITDEELNSAVDNAMLAGNVTINWRQR